MHHRLRQFADGGNPGTAQLRRARVLAAFFAEAERAPFGRAAAAAPPRRPPFRAGSLLTAWPRPEPDFLPPPVTLLTAPRPPLGFALPDATLLVTFLDVLGLAFLLVGVLGFVASRHR
jgi:hypothetical protein